MSFGKIVAFYKLFFYNDVSQSNQHRILWVLPEPRYVYLNIYHFYIVYIVFMQIYFICNVHSFIWKISIKFTSFGLLCLILTICASCFKNIIIYFLQPFELDMFISLFFTY